MSRLQQWRPAWATPHLLRATLFCLPLVDELVSGIPVLTLPLAREELHFTYAQVGLIFTVSELTGLLVDPALSAASDHWPKPRLVLGGMVGLALGFALAGSSPTFGWLLVAFMLIGATNGAVIGLGGLILIDQAPANVLSITTRWVFLATIGDLLGPLLVAATVALQGSWRLLMGSGAFIWFAFALFLGAQRFTKVSVKAAPEEKKEEKKKEEEKEEPLWRIIRTNLRKGFQTPYLMRWLLLATIPTLMDEMFLGFAGLFLSDIVGVQPSLISLALSAPVIGGLLSLGLMERFDKLTSSRFPNRLTPVRLLGGASLVTLAGLLCLLTARTLWPALIGLFFTGLGAAPWYPIAKAQAYTLLPGRVGTVRALQAVFTPFEIGAPLLIGLVAEQWGIQTGLGLLLAAPILVLLLRPR